MRERTRKPVTTNSVDLRLRLPSGRYEQALDAIRSVLDQADIPFRQVNDRGEELYTPAEMFGPPDPARILRGARAREGLTQRDLAERIGARQHHISEMENGRRAITPDMARKLARALNAADYRIFL